MQSTYNPGAAKRPTNLSIDSDLLRQARELDINLSHTLEQALAEVVSRKRADRWLQENREAIAQYNADVEQHGVFGQGY
ncbi:MAG: type II toxin-antitoxin system CcdA family antitoxin [Candidatus Competibacteraceae bacterium]